MFYAEIKSCDNGYIFDYKNSTNKKMMKNLILLL